MGAIRKKILDLPSSVKKSIADQIKLLSWAVGGLNGYFRHVLGSFSGALLVLICWFALQFFAHCIVYQIKEKGE